METEEVSHTIVDNPHGFHQTKDGYSDSACMTLGIDLARLAYQASVLEILEAKVRFYTEICLPHRFGGGPMRISDQLDIIMSRWEDQYEDQVDAIVRDMIHQRLLDYAYSPRWIVEQIYFLTRNRICRPEGKKLVGWRQKQVCLRQQKNMEMAINAMAQIPVSHLVGWIAMRAHLKFLDAVGEVLGVPVDEIEDDHDEEEELSC